MADAKAVNSLTFTVPRLEPPREAFTKSGIPRLKIDSVTVSGSRFHCDSVTVIPGAIAMPAFAKKDFASALSMASSDATAPLPTYGIPIWSRSLWSCPSSP